jgi:2-polyprenyl-6-methoxyphenol hydroxylase-like FAD-dependent oxidoreductase
MADSYGVTAWNKQGSLEQVLKVYTDFDPALKRLISKVDEAELKVWQLLDMEKLPSWTKGKLALLGDAAHPFTPRKCPTYILTYLITTMGRKTLGQC